MRKLKHILLLLTCLSFQWAHSQVGNGRIENLTDEQIVALLKQNNLLGLTPAELELKARDKGISSEQIKAIQKRLNAIDPALLQPSSGKEKETSRVEGDNKRLGTLTKGPRPREKDSTLQVFGSELFDRDGLNFEGNLSIPTPSNYVLGANDELVIDVYGISESTKKIKVSNEGMLRIPNLGPVKVSGLTMEQASGKIRTALTKIYPAIRSGQTQVSVSLGQIRTIQVTLVGEVNKPGSYALPSLATIMHAMYASGGPNAIGSYRDIQLIRGGKTIITFDLYDFLLNGKMTSNLILQDDDVVRVPPYSKRVAVKGAVKKQALFDVSHHENAANVIEYAGGMADLAFKDMIRVKRLGTQSRELLTINRADFSSFPLVSGDTLEVDTLAKRFVNRVTVLGAVYYPGEYGISAFKSLSALLQRVQPKENAFPDRAVLKRLQPDLMPAVIQFNVQDVMSGKNDMILQREDSIIIYDRHQIREQYTVSIEGEVNLPDAYPFADGMRVQDLILMAKGLKDGATLQRVEVARRLRLQNNGKDTAVYSIIQSLDIDWRDQDLRKLDVVLQPFDIVYIRKSPTYREQTNVTVDGEVLYPGKYTLMGANERLSDVISRAGGLKQTSFPEGAMLIRKTFQGSSSSDTAIYQLKYDLISNKNKQVVETNLDKKERDVEQDSLLKVKETREIFSAQKRVAVDLQKAMEKPGSRYDIVLEEGDVLKIPRIQQTVQSFGEVNYPQQMAYEEGLRFLQLINASGGFTNKASRKRAYVLEANGKVRSTTSFLFLRFYPRVSPGAEVYVPQRKDREPLSKGETIGITSGLVSLAGVMLAIINSLK